MNYIYLLRSAHRPEKTYVGATTDLPRRLREHNACTVGHTSKFQPWELVAYVAVADSAKARNLESYLKSGSGHAFAKKHLW